MFMQETMTAEMMHTAKNAAVPLPFIGASGEIHFRISLMHRPTNRPRTPAGRIQRIVVGVKP